MSNPFAKNDTAAVATDEAPNADLGFGGGADPFSDPTGVGEGKITDYVGRLLLVKPTELIKEMDTSNGPAENVVRADIAVLDGDEPGSKVDGVLLFQTALKREAGAVLKAANPMKPYLLGRLDKGKTGGGKTLYTFQTATEDDRKLAMGFLADNTL